jgi:hypothetical protein
LILDAAEWGVNRPAILNGHHTQQARVLLRDPKGNAIRDLASQFVVGRVALVPSVGRYDASIRLRRLFDDGRDLGQIIVFALSNVHTRPESTGSQLDYSAFVRKSVASLGDCSGIRE